MRKGFGKTASTCCVFFIVALGGIMMFVYPEKMDAFQQLCYGVAPILLAQMAAIWDGNMVRKKNVSDT